MPAGGGNGRIVSENRNLQFSFMLLESAPIVIDLNYKGNTMKKTLLAALAAAVLLSACGGNASSGGAAAKAAGPNSQARSTAFKVLGGDMKEIGGVVQGATAFDAEQFKAKITEFVAHSEEPFKHFAQDPNNAEGNARPEVWSNAAGFKAEEEKFAAAVAALNDAAQSGNLDNVKAAFGPVGGSCKSCHDGFKF